MAIEETRNWQSVVQADIQVPMDVARNLVQSMVAMKNEGTPNRDKMNYILKKDLEKYPSFLAIWTCWEANAFDNHDISYQNAVGHDETGRYIPYWNRLNGNIGVVALKNYSEDGASDYYQIPLKSGKEFVSDPIVYKINGQEFFKTIFSVPISFKGKTIGVVGIDIPFLKFFYPIIKKVRLLNIGYGFLVGNNGVIVAHPFKWQNVGKSLEYFAFEPYVIKAIQKGKEATQYKVSRATGIKNYYIFVPIKIGESDRPWSLAINIRPDLLKGHGSKALW